jgi:hypothetical protein
MAFTGFRALIGFSAVSAAFRGASASGLAWRASASPSLPCRPSVSPGPLRRTYSQVGPDSALRRLNGVIYPSRGFARVTVRGGPLAAANGRPTRRRSHARSFRRSRRFPDKPVLLALTAIFRGQFDPEPATLRSLRPLHLAGGQVVSVARIAELSRNAGGAVYFHVNEIRTAPPSGAIECVRAEGYPSAIRGTSVSVRSS